ncbi:hypothetical protein BJ508DRAFT_375766 [Ascobolus immersus RN42]|uniref:Uncharacterized protein n=1 Tax=Ascobolus immersus RN42 TaxID=1160509 RepID=A0A3N4I861_ASCIM|nr:hypothetical protein BJ508DRAFT_375766 [Ascobolus immersus RN42]
MTTIDKFTPLEIALFAILLASFVYHRRALQFAQRSIAEKQVQAKSSDSQPQTPKKNYVSSDTQTDTCLVELVAEADEPLITVDEELEEAPYESESEDFDDGYRYKKPYDYFAAPGSEMSEDARRVRLDLLIRSGTSFLEHFWPQCLREGPKAEIAQQGLFSRLALALPLTSRTISQKDETDERMRLIVAAFSKMFSAYENASLMAKQTLQATELYICNGDHSSQGASTHEKYYGPGDDTSPCERDDYGQRFEVPTLRQVRGPALEADFIGSDGFLEAAIKGYQLANEDEKVQIKNTLQKYILIHSQREIERILNVSYEYDHEESESTYRFPLLKGLDSISLHRKLLRVKSIVWPPSEALHGFDLDERTLEHCYKKCEVQFSFTDDNFIQLDEKSILTFHNFLTRLLRLISENVSLLESRRLERFSDTRTDHCHKHDEKSISLALKLLARTQSYLQSLGDLVHRSRSFQIYLHQPAVIEAVTEVELPGGCLFAYDWHSDAQVSGSFLAHRIRKANGIRNLRTAPVNITILEPLCVKPKRRQAGFRDMVCMLKAQPEDESFWDRIKDWDSGRGHPKDLSDYFYFTPDERRVNGISNASTCWDHPCYHSAAMMACLRSLSEKDVDKLSISTEDKKATKSVINELKVTITYYPYVKTRCRR